MTALGVGAAVGVVGLLAIQQRLHRDRIFPLAVMGTGAFLVLAASLSEPIFAALAVAMVGACAGTSYVTGFTVLQETVHDELRGRTFATLYSVIRLCLLVSLVISPLWSNFWDWVTSGILNHHRLVNLGGASYAFPGVRIALWGGGLITLAAGWWARHSIGHARRMQRANPHPGPADAGAT
jgi:dTMP kinase